MFGLTKREQRWKAEQQAAELLLGFVGTTIKAAAAVRVAEAESDAELTRLREDNAGLVRDLQLSTRVINMQLQTIKELEAQLAAHSDAQAQATAPHFDMLAHLRRQAEFSEQTFGPGARVEGVTDHIAKELIEVRESGGALSEWVDVIILGFDGAWRSGATPEQICEAIVAKQTKNESRNWPDWRTAPAGKAIEHDRSADGNVQEGS